MATTSQKMIEIRFFVRIRGAFTPPPTMEDPVMKMPLMMLSATGSRLCARVTYRTMRRQRPIDQCRNRCPSLPKRKAICSRGRHRPRQAICKQSLPAQYRSSIRQSILLRPGTACLSSISFVRDSCLRRSPYTVRRLSTQWSHPQRHM